MPSYVFQAPVQINHYGVIGSGLQAFSCAGATRRRHDSYYPFSSKWPNPNKNFAIGTNFNKIRLHSFGLRLISAGQGEFRVGEAMDIRVNADDLGLSKSVNDETFDLIDHGLLNSASIIANTPFAEDAIIRALSRPQCGFGVHLNFTEFAPLLQAVGDSDQLVRLHRLAVQATTLKQFRDQFQRI